MDIVENLTLAIEIQNLKLCWTESTISCNNTRNADPLVLQSKINLYPGRENLGFKSNENIQKSFTFT